jgi:hypothetical protein
MKTLSMKRWAFGSIAFFCTLVIGVSIAALFVFQTQYPERVAETPSHSESTAEQPPVQDDFVPEFRDLPNFDELEVNNVGRRVIEIYEGGIYWEDEVVAKNGETWLVLTVQNGNYSLKYLKASVKELKDVTWPGEERDVKLSFNPRSGEKHFHAFRGMQELKPGPVVTLFHKPWGAETPDGKPDYEEISDGYSRTFELNSRAYVLRQSTGLTRDRTKAAVLVLESEGKHQVVKQIYYDSDGRNIIGSLFWVGDLDGDGKLDLYFDEFMEKCSTRFEMHLSSRADPGPLVGLAGIFYGG